MMFLPRILVIDDFFGRNLPGQRNLDRERLCEAFLLKDVSPDAPSLEMEQQAPNPVAEAVFFRGQTGHTAIGEVVENDLPGSIETVRSGWTTASANGRPPWAMVLLDLCFYTGEITVASDRRAPGTPEGRTEDADPQRYFGLTLLAALRREFPLLPVMIFSSKSREEVSLQFSQQGALGFIDRGALEGPALLRDALWRHGLLADSAGEIVGFSLPLLLTLREARRAAGYDGNLLIRGERGTGKELVARYVHRVNYPCPFSDQSPFLTVNSAVLTPGLFAAELFGIQPRTATGVAGKTGLIEAASGGDLFLDEIADLHPEIQAALLRVLQERHFTLVGGQQLKTAEVRFISATNADLENPDSQFRSDLLDRLCSGGTLCLPPLRDRLEDLPLLAASFVRQAENKRKGSRQRKITPEAMSTLLAHSWPGNIRELRSCLFDAVNRHPDVEYLVPGHLRFVTTASDVPMPDETLTTSPAESADGEMNNLSGLLKYLDDFNFRVEDISQWAGRMAEIQRSQRWFLARYFKICLDATRRRTTDMPEGIIQIHPAVKMMVGDRSLSASQAADIIKRTFGLIAEELTGDLLAAYETALRLRPKKNRSSKK